MYYGECKLQIAKCKMRIGGDWFSDRGSKFGSGATAEAALVLRAVYLKH